MLKTKLFEKTAFTSAVATDSDPPYAFPAVKDGSLVIRCDNWGNTDNQLIVDVYWGAKPVGLIANAANLDWVKDATLTKTLTGAAGTTTDLVAVLDIPKMLSKYMKLVFTLSGTTKSVDVVAWLHGRHG